MRPSNSVILSFGSVGSLTGLIKNPGWGVYLAVLAWLVHIFLLGLFELGDKINDPILGVIAEAQVRKEYFQPLWVGWHQ